MADWRQVSAVGVPQQLDKIAAPPRRAIGASKFAAWQTALRLSRPAPLTASPERSLHLRKDVFGHR